MAKVTQNDVKKLVKQAGRAYVATVDVDTVDSDHRTGVWFTESHVAVLIHRNGIVADTLRGLNIDPETPVALTTSGANIVTESSEHVTIPNIAQVIPHPNDRGDRMHPMLLDGMPITVTDSAGETLVAYESEGSEPFHAYYNVQFVALAENVAKVGAQWFAPSPLKPATVLGIDGDIAAIVMPVRAK